MHHALAHIDMHMLILNAFQQEHRHTHYLGCVRILLPVVNTVYTPFNERMTSDRTETHPFCADLPSVVQRYIACYILRKPKSFSR